MFKDISITVHDHGALLITLAAHQDILQRKMTLCNDKLRQLHSTIEHVASEEQNWTMEYLTTEFEQMETQYEGLYRNSQIYLREFKVHKLKREKLEIKSNMVRKFEPESESSTEGEEDSDAEDYD